MSASRSARTLVSDPAEELEFVERLRRDPLFIGAQIALGLKLVLTVLVFDPQAFDAFSLTKSAVAHATSLVLAVLLVGLVLTHGRRILVWSPLHLFMGALLLCYAAASVLALDREVAIFGAWRRYLGLTQMADDAVLYVAVVLLLPTARDLIRLAVVTFTTAGIVVAYMFVQQLGLDPVKYIQGPDIRPIGTFGQPDLSGAYAGIVVAGALGVAAAAGALRPRILFAALAAAAFLALLFTNVRGGLLGLGLGFVAVVVLIVWGPHRPGRRTLAGLGGVAGLVVIAVLASPLRERLGAGLFSDLSAQSRLDTWGIAMDLVGRRPLLGLGPDNFAVAYSTVHTLQSSILNAGEIQTSTHDWPLQIATSAGVLGFLAFAALLVGATILGLWLARDGHPAALALPPLVAFIGQSLVTINDPGVDWIPWLCVGVIAGATGTRLLSPRRRKRAGPVMARSRAQTAIVLALAAVVLVATTIAARDRIAASEHFQLGEALQAANNGPAAIAESEAALSLDPRRAEHWSSAGAALNVDNKIVAASGAFAQAARLEPTQVIFWRNLGLMRLRLNDNHGGFVALERARAADAWDPETRDLLARVALLLNDPERAASEGHLAVQLRPREPTTFEAPVQADVALGRLSAAEALLRFGLTQIDPPGSLGLHVLLAQVLHEEKRNDEARAEVAAALAIDPQNQAALQLQAQYK